MGPVCDDTSTEKLQAPVQKEKGEQESYVAGSHTPHIHKNTPTIYEGKNEFWAEIQVYIPSAKIYTSV